MHASIRAPGASDTDGARCELGESLGEGVLHGAFALRLALPAGEVGAVVFQGEAKARDGGLPVGERARLARVGVNPRRRSRLSFQPTNAERGTRIIQPLKLATFLALLLLGMPRLDAAAAETPDLDAPQPIGPFLDGALPPRAPLAPGGVQWKVVDAFPDLPVTNALVIAHNPADDRLYVGTQAGTLVSFQNEPSVREFEPFLDLTDRVGVANEGGLLGLVFHPDFGEAGSPNQHSFYTYYTATCPITAERDAVDLSSCTESFPTRGALGFYDLWLRLSRFQARWDETAEIWRGDPASEEPLFSIRLYHYGHRGGGLLFGADGRLYLSIGDQVRRWNAQNITRALEGGVLRIDVNVGEEENGEITCPAGSHLPRRRYQEVSPHPDEVSGKLYCIPDDNPWLDENGAVFEEYFAIGHRNPYRLSVDRITGRLWSGEAGEIDREEINVIEPGANYGWPFREGFKAGPEKRPDGIVGIVTDPVIDFARSEASALIGGTVYRGTRFPELVGRYIAGDHVTRNLWAVTLDETLGTATKERLTRFEPGFLANFGEDRNGELVMASIGEGVPLQRLERIGPSVPHPPSQLSALGAFIDLETLEAHPAALPYDVVPAWADGAVARRWIFLPGDGERDAPHEQIVSNDPHDWQFPVGTVVMQHLELPVDDADPSRVVRLETRFLVHGDDERWYGVSYRWRDDASDADLLTGPEARDLETRLADGHKQTRTWSYPTRDQCQTCHTPAAGGVLGLRTHQLNRDLRRPGSEPGKNQLDTWSALGMLAPPLASAESPAAAEIDDITASLELRARSWLDVNCAGCHRPESGLANGFDARLSTPLPEQGLVWGEALDDLGTEDAHLIHPGRPDASIVLRRVAAMGPLSMPRLTSAYEDRAAQALLSAWVERIPATAPRTGLAYEYFEVRDMVALPDFDREQPFRSGSSPTFDLSPREREDDYAFRFRASLQVPAEGDWTFSTSSDDGSQLFIDGHLVVDNDGIHRFTEQSGTVALSAGFHDLVVTMFDRNGPDGLAVAWQGPGVPKQPIPAARLFREPPGAHNDEPPTLENPGNQTHSIGDEVHLQLLASDPEGTPLYHEATGLPDGLSLDPGRGTISGTVGSSSDPPHAVTLSVSDGAHVATAQFEWHVRGPGPPAWVLLAGTALMAGAAAFWLRRRNVAKTARP
jgi:mono/diheme cytochrome c family protein